MKRIGQCGWHQTQEQPSTRTDLCVSLYLNYAYEKSREIINVFSSMTITEDQNKAYSFGENQRAFTERTCHED